MPTDPLLLVAQVHALGVTVRVDGPDLVLAPAGVVPPDLKAELVAAKPALLALLRDPEALLRVAYRAVFWLTVHEEDGARIDPQAAGALHQEILRHTDNLGLSRADAAFADELRRFRWETARCGLCGGLGHEIPHESGDVGQ